MSTRLARYEDRHGIANVLIERYPFHVNHRVARSRGDAMMRRAAKKGQDTRCLVTENDAGFVVGFVYAEIEGRFGLYHEERACSVVWLEHRKDVDCRGALLKALKEDVGDMDVLVAAEEHPSKGLEGYGKTLGVLNDAGATQVGTIWRL